MPIFQQEPTFEGPLEQFLLFTIASCMLICLLLRPTSCWCSVSTSVACVCVTFGGYVALLILGLWQEWKQRAFVPAFPAANMASNCERVLVAQIPTQNMCMGFLHVLAECTAGRRHAWYVLQLEDVGLQDDCRLSRVFRTISDIFNSFCHHAAPSLAPSTLRNMKLWTAMKCVGQNECSLHLSVKGTLHLGGNIHGMEICSLSMDTQSSQCVNVKISRQVPVKLAGRKVKVQFNCFEVSAGQHLHVTMRTIPNYCSVKMNQEYYVEDCRNGDVEKSIPACFAGKMAFDVDRTRKLISVDISEVVQGTDYYIRLCREWFVCEDEGPVTLVQGKDLVKSVSLPYTQLLSCLCIEFWQRATVNSDFPCKSLQGAYLETFVFAVPHYRVKDAHKIQPSIVSPFGEVQLYMMRNETCFPYFIPFLVHGVKRLEDRLYNVVKARCDEKMHQL
ncbi:putative interleukin-17 receptor E-like [Varanus komodoensis]|nr:putative interleukin-17 receptor E-like [Varanus komodoensis]